MRVGRVYVAMAALLTTIVAVAPLVWGRGDAPPRPHVVSDVIFGNWLWWDGGWYLHIAQSGYSFHAHQQSSVAFFPVYPMTVRAVGALLPGGIGLAAIAVTMLGGIAAFALFERWCARRLPLAATSAAVFTLALYPYAWFLYGAAYSDALFLAVTLAAFLLLECDRPVEAGLVGIAATAGRPTGVVVLIGLIAVMLDRRDALPHIAGRLRRRDLGVGLAALGIVGWCTWLAVRFGHPLAFIEAEGAKGWDQAPGVATWLKFAFFSSIVHAPVRTWAPLVAQAALCVAFAAAIPAVARRFGRGYAIYVASAVALPAVSTGDFMGTGRYLLAAFPVFALVGARLADLQRGRWVYFGVSSAGLALGTSLFATGHLLA
jgi:Gpi18-like mannosyltransferase